MSFEYQQRHVPPPSDELVADVRARQALDVDVNPETGLPGDFINMWAGEISKLSDKRSASNLASVPKPQEYLEKKIQDNPEMADTLKRIYSKKKAKKTLKILEKLATGYNKRTERAITTDRLSNWEELQRICFDATAAIKGRQAAERDRVVGSWNKVPSIL